MPGQICFSSKGFSLIEIMIVVALMAILMTVGAFSLGILGHADVNGEALRLSSAIRYTFNMSATSNKTLQMKIDFENNEFSVEELELVGGLSDEELVGTTMSNRDSKFSRRDAVRAEKLDNEDTKFGKVNRTTVDEMFLTGDDAKLKDGVYFLGLMTSHHDDIQRDGVGTINFFSNGFVERSVIFLGDENARDDKENGIFYTISISPLTGNSSVQPGKTEISSSFFEEEEDD